MSNEEQQKAEYEQRKALYIVAWNDLNGVISNVRKADELGDVDTVREGLCTAAIYVDKLKPHVKEAVMYKPQHSELLSMMTEVSKANSPDAMLNGMEKLLDAFATERDSFTVQIEADVHTAETVHKMLTDSSSVCNYRMQLSYLD